MNSFFIAVTWVGQEHRFLGLDWNYLVVLGLIGNATFSMRFLVQWYASEKKGESVIPISFWYWSIGGSIIVCSYFGKASCYSAKKTRARWAILGESHRPVTCQVTSISSAIYAKPLN